MGAPRSLEFLATPTKDNESRMAIRAIESLKTDSWPNDSRQSDKLHSWMPRPDVILSTSITVRLSAHYDVQYVMGTLNHHLRSRRLSAIVVDNLYRQDVSTSSKRREAAAANSAGATAAGSNYALTAQAGSGPGFSGSRVLALTE